MDCSRSPQLVPSFWRFLRRILDSIASSLGRRTVTIWRSHACSTSTLFGNFGFLIGSVGVAEKRVREGRRQSAYRSVGPAAALCAERQHPHNLEESTDGLLAVLWGKNSLNHQRPLPCLKLKSAATPTLSSAHSPEPTTQASRCSWTQKTLLDVSVSGRRKE